ncbi:MAG: DNA polymerase III subunit beta [Patescibacteria group bacterium]
MNIKLSMSQEKILNPILMAERIVGKKESLPVLSCILIDVGASVFLRATNLEAAIEIKIHCNMEGEGKIAVPSGVLSQTIRSIGVGKVVLSVDDGNLVVESKGNKTIIKSVPYDEFPTLPTTNGTGGIRVSRGRLISGIQSVLYSASPSMIRPELGSVYIALGGKKLTCVATDSFRLAEKIIVGDSGESETLIPLKHALELVHVLEKINHDEITIVIEESQLTIMADDIRFISRVVDGNFPNYKEIIPKTFSTEATILKGDFSEMLKKARIFSGNDQHVGLHVYPERKIFSATARSQDVGEMSDSIDAALSGEDLDINFHIGYLADCLPVIESDSILLKFAGAGKPLVIRGVSDSSFTYLVMPLNR